MRDFKVYCHTLFDGRKYIGITCQPLNRRWRNGEGYKSKDGYFYNAIKKHGWDAFSHEVLIHGLSEDEAKAIERLLITLFKTQDRSKGFNISGGGDGMFNPTEETRQKIGERSRNFHTGRKQSAETRKKHSDWMKAHNPNKGGKCVTEKHIEAFREIAKRPKSAETRRKMSEASRKRKIICVETGIVYDSMKQAAEMLGAYYTTIACAVYDPKRRACGYHWRAYEGL